MWKAKKQLITEQLALICGRIPTAYAMAVVNVDGLIMASWDKERNETLTSEEYEYYIEEDRLSAMSAAMLSLGERIVSQLTTSPYKYGLLRGDRATIFQIVLGDEYVLTFGVREVPNIDAVLVIVQQWWGELLHLLDVPAPKL